MVNSLKIIIINFMIIILSCGSSSISNQHEIQLSYDEGVEFYNKKKYSKAKESFKYVILNSTGSRLALESEFYLSESLYKLKEYEEALYGYNNYARSSQDLELIELSRFRLCQCAYNLTADYNKDQTTTVDAIDKVEIFLEDYPESKYYSDVLSIKLNLKHKLAKKEYESAVLYMKLQEYKSALVYLFEIINNHIPLKQSSFPIMSLNEQNILLQNLLDNSRIMIIYAYILDERKSMAQEFYQLQVNNFYDLKSKDKAGKLINSHESTGLDMWKHIYFGISK